MTQASKLANHQPLRQANRPSDNKSYSSNNNRRQQQQQHQLASPHHNSSRLTQAPKSTTTTSSSTMSKQSSSGSELARHQTTNNHRQQQQQQFRLTTTNKTRSSQVNEQQVARRQNSANNYSDSSSSGIEATSRQQANMTNVKMHRAANIEQANQQASGDASQQTTWDSVDALFWDHLEEVEAKWSTLKMNDDIWAKLIYFERNRRLAKAYVSAPVLTIDGSTQGLDGFRIGLSGIDNQHRTLDSMACLRSIGRGIRLRIDSQGNIIMRRNHNTPADNNDCAINKPDCELRATSIGTVHVRSWLQQQQIGRVATGSDSSRCSSRELLAGQALKLFDMQKFRLRLLQHQNPNQQQPDWRQCVNLISFMKPSSSSSLDPLEDSCWLMIINIIAIDMLKSVHQHHQQPAIHYPLALSQPQLVYRQPLSGDTSANMMQQQASSTRSRTSQQQTEARSTSTLGSQQSSSVNYGQFNKEAPSSSASSGVAGFSSASSSSQPPSNRRQSSSIDVVGHRRSRADDAEQAGSRVGARSSARRGEVAPPGGQHHQRAMSSMGRYTSGSQQNSHYQYQSRFGLALARASSQQHLNLLANKPSLIHRSSRLPINNNQHQQNQTIYTTFNYNRFNRGLAVQDAAGQATRRETTSHEHRLPLNQHRHNRVGKLSLSSFELSNSNNTNNYYMMKHHRALFNSGAILMNYDDEEDDALINDETIVDDLAMDLEFGDQASEQHGDEKVLSSSRIKKQNKILLVEKSPTAAAAAVATNDIDNVKKVEEKQQQATTPVAAKGSNQQASRSKQKISRASLDSSGASSHSSHSASSSSSSSAGCIGAQNDNNTCDHPYFTTLPDDGDHHHHQAASSSCFSLTSNSSSGSPAVEPVIMTNDDNNDAAIKTTNLSSINNINNPSSDSEHRDSANNSATSSSSALSSSSQVSSLSQNSSSVEQVGSKSPSSSIQSNNSLESGQSRSKSAASRFHGHRKSRDTCESPEATGTEKASQRALRGSVKQVHSLAAVKKSRHSRVNGGGLSSSDTSLNNIHSDNYATSRTRSTAAMVDCPDCCCLAPMDQQALASSKLKRGKTHLDNFATADCHLCCSIIENSNCCDDADNMSHGDVIRKSRVKAATKRSDNSWIGYHDKGNPFGHRYETDEAIYCSSPVINSNKHHDNQVVGDDDYRREIDPDVELANRFARYSIDIGDNQGLDYKNNFEDDHVKDGGFEESIDRKKSHKNSLPGLGTSDLQSSRLIRKKRYGNLISRFIQPFGITTSNHQHK